MTGNRRPFAIADSAAVHPAAVGGAVFGDGKKKRKKTSSTPLQAAEIFSILCGEGREWFSPTTTRKGQDDERRQLQDYEGLPPYYRK